MGHDYEAALKDFRDMENRAIEIEYLARKTGQRFKAILHALEHMSEIERGECVVVPKEPTVEMHNAGCVFSHAKLTVTSDCLLRLEPATIDPSKIYKAMIAAAPKMED